MKKATKWRVENQEGMPSKTFKHTAEDKPEWLGNTKFVRKGWVAQATASYEGTVISIHPYSHPAQKPAGTRSKFPDPLPPHDNTHAAEQTLSKRPACIDVQ